MSQDLKQKLLNHLNNASETDSRVVVNQDGKPSIVILSESDYQKFLAEREARLNDLRQKLDSILTLVRSYTQQRTLEDIEDQLVALRKEIEQEMSE